MRFFGALLAILILVWGLMLALGKPSAEGEHPGEGVGDSASEQESQGPKTTELSAIGQEGLREVPDEDDSTPSSALGGWRLEVTVVDGEGDPISFARVEGRINVNQVEAGQTGSDGICLVQFQPSAQDVCFLTVKAGSFATTFARVVIPDKQPNTKERISNTIVVLRPGATLFGKVVNIVDGEIPRGLSVTALSATSYTRMESRNSGGIQDRLRTATVKVDDSGLFEIPGLRRDKKYMVEISSLDYSMVPGRGSHWGVPGPERITLMMSPILGASVRYRGVGGESVPQGLTEHIRMACRHESGMVMLPSRSVGQTLRGGGTQSGSGSLTELRFVFGEAPKSIAGPWLINCELELPGFEPAVSEIHLSKTKGGKAGIAWVDLVPLAGDWATLVVRNRGRVTETMGKLVFRDMLTGTQRGYSLFGLSKSQSELSFPVRAGTYSISWQPEHVELPIALNGGKGFRILPEADNLVGLHEPDGYGYVICGFAEEGNERIDGGVVILSDGNIRGGDPVKWLVPITFQGDELSIGPLSPATYYVVPELPKRVPEAGRYLEVKAGQTVEDWFVLD